MAGCIKCGAPIKAGSRFCEYCGSRVDMGALESVLAFVEDRAKRKDEAARAAQAAKAEAARIAKEREPKELMVLALIFVVGMLLLGVGGLLEYLAGGNTEAMPAASELEGENYEDVKTRLLAAGFTNIETASMDDLIVGWLKKDGEVERVSVDGETDFWANSKFPKTAKIVITYHTFPKETSDNATEGSPTEGNAQENQQQAPDTTILTPENSAEFEAVLKAEDPGDPEVQEFIEKYAGRTIEFDAHTWDWFEDSGTTIMWAGDNLADPDAVEEGPLFRVEGFHMPDSSPLPARKNVHVRAVVDRYDADHEFFRVTLLSLETR